MSDQLPGAFRSAVLLIDGEGNSYESAAALLGVPVGTVRSRLFRGRRLLQAALFDHAREAGLVAPSPAHERASGAPPSSARVSDD